MPENENINIKVGDYIYWARVIPKLNMYDVLDLKVRAVTDTYVTAVDTRNKQAYPFGFKCFGKIVFTNRSEAVEIVKDKELEREWVYIIVIN